MYHKISISENQKPWFLPVVPPLVASGSVRRLAQMLARYGNARRLSAFPTAPHRKRREHLERNRIMTGVRFLFRVTLCRHDLAAEVRELSTGGSFSGSSMSGASVETAMIGLDSMPKTRGPRHYDA
jgi:hypothetical protein